MPDFVSTNAYSCRVGLFPCVVGLLFNLISKQMLCRTVWLTRNEVIFDKCRPKSFLHVLFRGSHWLQQWATLQQREDIRDLLTLVGSQLEMAVLQFFSSNGRLSTRRIGPL